jgi:hypothetical protein
VEDAATPGAAQLRVVLRDQSPGARGGGIGCAVGAGCAHVLPALAAGLPLSSVFSRSKQGTTNTNSQLRAAIFFVFRAGVLLLFISDALLHFTYTRKKWDAAPIGSREHTNISAFDLHDPTAGPTSRFSCASSHLCSTYYTSPAPTNKRALPCTCTMTTWASS